MIIIISITKFILSYYMQLHKWDLCDTSFQGDVEFQLTTYYLTKSMYSRANGKNLRNLSLLIQGSILLHD
jgi:hypothetical protein